MTTDPESVNWPTGWKSTRDHDLNLREKLAEIEHTRWSDWQRYLFQQGQREADGSITLPAELVTMWERKIATPYAELTELEKQSDRDQVNRYWHLIRPEQA